MDNDLLQGYDGVEWERQLALWHKCRFPGRNLPGTYRKLLEEVGELGEALMNADDEGVEEEAADVGILLSHILRICCNRSLVKSIQVKHAILENRLHENAISNDD
jgi:NTP pyrophosphatase (non-canonical NTP hydrolase)